MHRPISHQLSAAEGDEVHDPAAVGVGQVIVDLEPIVADPAELLIEPIVNCAKPDGWAMNQALEPGTAQ